MTWAAVCRLAIRALQLAAYSRQVCQSARWGPFSKRELENHHQFAVLMRRASANISQPTRANQTRVPAHGCMAMAASGFVIAGRG